MYGDVQPSAISHAVEAPAFGAPATLWERFCMGQHYVYIGGASLYAARHFLQKPTGISKAFGGTLFLCGAALITAVIYPFSFWQKPVENFRKRLSQSRV